MTQPPGFLTITADEYHLDQIGNDQPSLSAGIASILINASPKHAWTAHPKLNPDYQPREDKKFDIGKAAHRLLLEGVDSVIVVEAENWRTKAAQEAQAEARAAGLTPLLAREWEAVRAMVDAANSQLAEFSINPFPFIRDGCPEQPIFWH